MKIRLNNFSTFVFALSFSLLVLGTLEERNVFSEEENESEESISLNALLISIESYDVQKLNFATNDLEELNDLIQMRYGGTTKRILDQPVANRPTNAKNNKKEIESNIVRWVKERKNNELGILYLAGHGIKGSDGKLYYPMRDYRPDRFEETTISMEWIRNELDKAAGKGTLILLDACYSGTDRGADDSGTNPGDVGPAEMAKSLNSSKNTTFASSRTDQVSWLWEKMEHSLFTYWVIDALDGNADIDRDRYITLKELEEYVGEKVAEVSKNDDEFKFEQNPTMLHPEAIADSFRLPVRVFTVDRLIDDLSKRIERLAKDNEMKCLMIPEFLTGEYGDSIQKEYGGLAKLISEKFGSTLGEKLPSSYGVYREKTSREILAQYQITTDRLETNLDKLRRQEPPIQGVVLGRIAKTDGDFLEVTVTLFDVQSGLSKGSKKGVAYLTPDILASAGNSFVAASTNGDSRGGENASSFEAPQAPDVKTEWGFLPENTIAEIRETQKESVKPHPITDRSLMFDLEFQVRKDGSNWTTRPGALLGNEYYLPLDPGEQYAILPTNKREENVYMKILVDGMDTMAHKKTGTAKDLGVESNDVAENENEFEPARVELKDALPWFLPGVTSTKNRRPFQAMIRGFYDPNTDVPTESSVYQFAISDADVASTDRLVYADQLGLITVAFYTSVSNRGAETDKVATVPSGKENVALKKTNVAERCGDLIVVYNVRYVSTKKLNELKNASREPSNADR